MNLILSCIAALQAPVIMMSQNRQEEKDRMRSENDYLINLKAEMQIRSLHQKMDLLLEEQIKTLFDTQQKQFDLLKEINSKLNKASWYSAKTLRCQRFLIFQWSENYIVDLLGLLFY